MGTAKNQSTKKYDSNIAVFFDKDAHSPTNHTQILSIFISINLTRRSVGLNLIFNRTFYFI